MLIQNERIICILHSFLPFWNGFSTQILSRLGVCLRDNLASAQTSTDGETSPHVTQPIYFYPVTFLKIFSIFRRRNISPVSGWRAQPSTAATLTRVTERARASWRLTRTLVTELARSGSPGPGTRPPSPPSSRATRWCSRSRSLPGTRTAWCPWAGSAAHGWWR